MTEQDTLFPFWSGHQAEQQRLRYAIQAAQVGTWNLDVAHQRVWWDKRCQELCAFDGHDVVDYEQFLVLVHQEDRPRVDQAIDACLDPSSAGYFDALFRTSEHQPDQTRWIHAQGRAYIDIVGAAYRLSGVMRDVTAQVQTRQQLEINKARLRSLVLDSPNATALFAGRDIVIETVNTPMLRLWGTDESVVGQPLQQVLTNLATEPAVELLQRIYDTGESYQQPATQIHGVVNGHRQELWFNLAYQPVYAHDGNIYGVLSTATDVTAQVVALRESEQRYRLLSKELEHRVEQRTRELAQANDQLKRSNDSLQEFAYVASHDLQEPLRKIQQFGDLLKNRHATQLGEGVDYLERMQSAAGRMSRLIRDLLTFSRIATSQPVAMRVPLNDILDQTLVDLELLLSETQAVVDRAPLPVVMGDALQLGQLFQNLLTNALKFSRVDQRGTPAVPNIVIQAQLVAFSDLLPNVKPARHAETYHRITISDNGIGFDEKYLDRIFQIFQRLHRQTEFAGTGIGLAICQRVVTNHGGALTASSQPGQGATFCVYLPA
ncbi:sensor histidine kinase [Spirosoma rhododendri]|uniref:histidine kinase n=1 Tax=Spirosoma rhododendri TaxID=2728024 RepID=A0A7L5DQD3_9BACT|nr:ATP-binding protein [Spirosoma rhododendri]QJD79423.1 PAS domain-containing protein [Spirosoma rhododendri]